MTTTTTMMGGYDDAGDDDDDDDDDDVDDDDDDDDDVDDDDDDVDMEWREWMSNRSGGLKRFSLCSSYKACITHTSNHAIWGGNYGSIPPF